MKKENKIQRQEPTPIGFYSVCFYSLSGNQYPEENRYFNLHAKTYSGLIAKLRKEYSHYAEGPGYKIYAPWTWSKSTNGNPTHAVFEAAYTFGPKVQYHIYIKEIYSEDLTD